MSDRYVARFVKRTTDGNAAYALIDTSLQPRRGGEVIATVGVRSTDVMDRIAAALNADEARRSRREPEGVPTEWPVIS